MGWTMPKPDEINVQEAQTKGSFELIPAGTYTLQLLPKSAIDERGSLQLAVAIADGDFKGRRVFPSLPQAQSVNDWPNQAIKQIATVTGTEFVEGEGPADYLNRVATNGHSRFQVRLYHKPYTKRDGSEATDVRLAWNSISPAA